MSEIIQVNGPNFTFCQNPKNNQNTRLKTQLDDYNISQKYFHTKIYQVKNSILSQSNSKSKFSKVDRKYNHA